jgi:hypothetical protein
MSHLRTILPNQNLRAIQYITFPMQSYFSHSYRDVPTNAYFSALFDDAGIELRADQKTEVWCVAKLERYMFDMGGFVSIIPRRVAPDGSVGYSPYISFELMLARRARIPRIVFVDDQVLDLHRSVFPASAIPFFHQKPETESGAHVDAISEFRKKLASDRTRSSREYEQRTTTVITSHEPQLRDAASQIAAILRRDQYRTKVVHADALDRVFDNIDTFEQLLASEFCVFVLDRALSSPDLLLAMAHAHCIPSVRLRHDPSTESSDPELSGAVRWRGTSDLVPAFEKLFQNYQSVFSVASGANSIQELSTPKDVVRSLSEWNPQDGPGLVLHVLPDDNYVSDRVEGVRRQLTNTEPGRLHSDAVCNSIYDRVRRERFYYTFEPVLSNPSVQRIRKPKEIAALECGTCIDSACLFASMLEAAHEWPVLIVFETPSGNHALAGYVTLDAVLGEPPMLLGTLRGTISRGEVIVFETTGAFQAISRAVVAAETPQERQEGGKTLDFRTAIVAGRRLVFQEDVRLRYFVDVREARRALR